MVLRLFILICLLSSLVSSQSYPYWFLYPSKANCGDATVGYSVSGYYDDSIAVAALENGCENYAKNNLSIIKGGQGFWSTEMGTFWMGSDIYISYDTLLAIYAKEKLKQIDTFSNGRLSAVLIAETECEYPSDIIDITKTSKPNWIEELPQFNEYLYSVGLSQGYYYESSSWKKAEDNARIELARLFLTKISALSKKDSNEGQVIKEENIDVKLTNVGVTQRWVDVSNNIFYVLIRMKL